jgi:hypothetical protein
MIPRGYIDDFREVLVEFLLLLFFEKMGRRIKEKIKLQLIEFQPS